MMTSLAEGIAPYPLLCQPLFKVKVWGGRRLEKLFGKPLPEDIRVGESWEIADLPEGASKVANGPLASRPLTEAVALWGEALRGRRWPEGRFPLLVKLLDAQDDLSVQVHPSDADCARDFPGHHGKDESWIVLDAAPGSKIYHGFRDGVTRETLERALADGTALDCLRAIDARPGDVFRVAPGTPHALGRGVAILEIQQPSDSTFRLFDYNRPGDDGRPRPLHIVESLRVARFDSPPALVAARPHFFSWGSHELLVDCPAYRIERFDTRATANWSVSPESAQALVTLSGGGQLRAGDTTVAVKPGDAVVLPARVGRVSLTCAALSVFALAGAGGSPLMSSAML